MNKGNQVQIGVFSDNPISAVLSEHNYRDFYAYEAPKWGLAPVMEQSRSLEKELFLCNFHNCDVDQR